MAAPKKSAAPARPKTAKKASSKKAPAKRAPAKPAAEPPANAWGVPDAQPTPPAAPSPPPLPPVPPGAPPAGWAPAAAPAPGGKAPMQPSEERQYAMLLHISALAGVIVGGLFFLGPLIMWLIKKDESPFVDRHGRAALDFFISLAIYTVVAAVLVFAIVLVTFGLGLLLLLPVLFVAAILMGLVLILLPILAAVKANQGQEYRYPLAMAFLSKNAPAPAAPPAP